jgi:DNA-3-methyladenine glycosylase
VKGSGLGLVVLIRGIEPIGEMGEMRRNRPRASKDSYIGSGSGKLCQALAMDRGMNGSSLERLTLWIADRGFEPARVVTSPRIGVDYAGEHRTKSWRFFLDGSTHVSRHKLNRVATKVPRRIRRNS